MLKRIVERTGHVKVTFALPDSGECVSVVGDFNGWDPFATPLKRRSNGTRSVSVVLPPGRPYAFRYLAEGGRWFDDHDADAVSPNGYGETHSVVVT
jgi:1,4-alpha-glucan branching enzyme